jgi:hypothetical protein
MNWRAWLALLGALQITFCADVNPESLLARVRTKVVADAKAIPRYICRQNIEQRNYFPNSKTPQLCATIPEAALKDPAAGRRLITADRARLDVILTSKSELFSWPGGHHFDADNPGDLLAAGISGSGDFASFRIGIFMSDRVDLRYDGPCGDSCLRYRYDVPLDVSHYILKTALDETIVAYHGVFEADSNTAELSRLTVIPTDLRHAVSGMCAMSTAITYSRTASNAGQFMIPTETEKVMTLDNGSYFESKITYEGCRQYSSESTLTFSEPSPEVMKPSSPPGVPPAPVAESELDLRLISKIDSKTNVAGDAIEAALSHPVRDAAGGAIPAGTVVRGHLAQVERVYFPRDEIMLAMRFDSIRVGGSDLPLQLEPVGRRDLRGRALFVFPGSRIVLDQKFKTRWHVRAYDRK